MTRSKRPAQPPAACAAPADDVGEEADAPADAEAAAAAEEEEAAPSALGRSPRAELIRWKSALRSAIFVWCAAKCAFTQSIDVRPTRSEMPTPPLLPRMSPRPHATCADCTPLTSASRPRCDGARGTVRTRQRRGGDASLSRAHHHRSLVGAARASTKAVRWGPTGQHTWHGARDTPHGR
eukprot:3322669-Prymnesium_polylepis.2